MDPFKRDYKLEGLIGQTPYGNMIVYDGLRKSLQTEALRSVVEAFGVNVLRAESLLMLPAIVAIRAELHGMGAPLLLPPPSPLGPPDELWASDDSLKVLRASLERGWAFAQLVLPAIGVGIDAWLSAMLVGTWTAFETLAGDLWMKSVNAQPQYLAGLTGAANRIGKRARDKTRSNQEEEKEGEKEQGASGDDDACESPSRLALTLGDLCKITRGGYDLGDKMGSLLAEAKQVQFTSLANIREAYSLAFPAKVKKARSNRIDEALADNALDALSAVRNLIVHKAGAADAAYVTDCKAAPTAPALKEKDMLQLDGETCRSLVDPVVKSSVELAKAVDSWLTLTRR